MMDLRVAILGAGMIGAVHRRSALLAGAEVVGVMASTPARSTEVAERWRTSAIGDLDDLTDLAPDVVHVCTPNGLHAEQVEAAVAAGAHVVCEKPLAVGASAAEHLAAVAAGRIATVPFVYRFHPLVREIRARIAVGELGAVRLVHGSYLQDWLRSPVATSWRIDPAVGGPSRAFADIGSHWCDLAEFVTGDRIATLSAATTITVPQRPAVAVATFSGTVGDGPLVPVDTEDAAALTFRTVGGALGTVIVSQVSAGRKNRLWIEVDGAEAAASFDQEQPETVWIGREDHAEIVQRDPARGSSEQRRLSSLPAGHPQGYAQCFEQFVADTYRAVRGETPEGLPTFADGVRSARVVDAVLESARTGQWVEVARTEEES